MKRWVCLVAAALTVLAAAYAFGRGPAAGEDEIERFAISGFAFALEVRVPATPAAAYDAFTGDVSGWWDHSFAERPAALVIEGLAGGRFLERFDDAGDGALHATVTFARRGAELHFTGALGLASLGVPLAMVHKLTFTADGEDTVVKLTVRAMGEVRDGWPEAVRATWNHFLVERYAPFVRALK